MATVAGNVIGYTKGEISRAKKVSSMIKRLGYCSTNEAMRMLNSGNLMEANLTSSDVDRARSIYGPMIAREKGFMTDIGPVGLIRHEHAVTLRDIQVHIRIPYARWLMIIYYLITSVFYLMCFSHCLSFACIVDT